MCRADRDAERSGREQSRRRSSLCAESSKGTELGDLHSHSMDYSPASKPCSKRNRRVRHQNHIEGNEEDGTNEALGEQKYGNDSHGLLSIIGSMSYAVKSGRD